MEYTALSIGIIIGLYFILRASATFAIPLVSAALLAALWAPAMGWAEKRAVPRWLSMLTAMGMTVLASVVVAALTWYAVSSVVTNLDAYLVRFGAATERFEEMLRDRFGDEAIPERLSLIGAVGQSQFIGDGSLGAKGAKAITSVATFLVFLLLFLTALLGARHTFADKFQRALTVTGVSEDRAEGLMVEMALRVQQYLFLKTIISVMTGLAFGGVAAVLGLDFPVAWGLLAFILNYIPSLGPILASVPPVFIAFLQFDSGYATIVAACMSGVQFLSGNVIEPLVLGDRLRLNFIVVLVAVSAGGIVWGFPGMILSVPLAAVFKLLLAESASYRPIAELLGRGEDP